VFEQDYQKQWLGGKHYSNAQGVTVTDVDLLFALELIAQAVLHPWPSCSCAKMLASVVW
jgi:hypothetical protein